MGSTLGLAIRAHSWVIMRTPTDQRAESELKRKEFHSLRRPGPSCAFGCQLRVVLISLTRCAGIKWVRDEQAQRVDIDRMIECARAEQRAGRFYDFYGDLTTNELGMFRSSQRDDVTIAHSEWMIAAAETAQREGRSYDFHSDFNVNGADGKPCWVREQVARLTEKEWKQRKTGAFAPSLLRSLGCST
jgi:hypothetical protein